MVIFRGDNYAGNANTSRLQLRLFPRRSPSSTPIFANVNSRLFYSKATWGKQRKRSSQEQTCKSTETEMKRIPQSSSAYQVKLWMGKRTLPHQNVAQKQMQRTRMQKPPPQQTIGAKKPCQRNGYRYRLVKKTSSPERKILIERKKNIEKNKRQLSFSTSKSIMRITIARKQKNTHNLSSSLSLSLSLARAHGARLSVGSSS